MPHLILEKESNPYFQASETANVLALLTLKVAETGTWNVRITLKICFLLANQRKKVVLLHAFFKA